MEENKRRVQIRDKFRCDFIEYIPKEELDETKQLYLTDEERYSLGITKCFDLENNCVIDYDNTEDLKKQKLEELRAKREPLLNAFDKYKSNVVYGVEIENDTQRSIILNWYQQIKDLNENYIVKEENIPNKIKYYL